MNFKKKSRKNIQLDITPIVDMVFNLLIFFALSINFSAAAAINLTLPKTVLPDTAPAQASVIQIDSDLGIAVDRVPTDYAALPEIVAALQRTSGQSSIIIMASDSVPHGFVVTVMDMCRQAGFERISISARVK